ncbi:MAG TPA: NUDIX hydrolase [Pirellulales bacterium]|nr:NUDIX hydrolase [Pirellulales bacterium]
MNSSLTTLTRIKPVEQASAVPLRCNGGGVEVCLITSMGRGRWIFPKGVVDPGETHVVTAQKEALEEAGITGRLLDPPLGQYRDSKWDVPLLVTVFAMSVETVYDTWLEETLRRRRWTNVEDARELITDPTLREMLELAIRRFSENGD